jgi:two-component system, chemotaxis family, protein-glutamate methylesterase/glutaminase
MAKIRALIVDDSRTIRSIVRALLSRDPEIEVVGEAGDPYEARAAIKALDPDVITLDVEMPRMDGLEFLGHLMRLRPMPVVMVSSLTGKGSAAAIRALSLGAVDCVDREEIRRDVSGGSRLCAIVRTAARARVQTRREPFVTSTTDNFTPNGKLLLIGSSTGGVDALERVFSRFPENCPPTLVAQHMPPAFLASFAQRLNDTLRPNVRLARHGEVAEVGTILLAPGGTHHLTVSPKGKPIIRIVDEDGSHLHTPCVDMLFESAVPRAPDVVAAILTGMGRDGAEGLLKLRQAGATTIAQSGRTAVVDGMPRVARELGAASKVADLADISRLVLSACAKTVATA